MAEDADPSRETDVGDGGGSEHTEQDDDADQESQYGGGDESGGGSPGSPWGSVVATDPAVVLNPGGTISAATTADGAATALPSLAAFVGASQPDPPGTFRDSLGILRNQSFDAVTAQTGVDIYGGNAGAPNGWGSQAPGAVAPEVSSPGWTLPGLRNAPTAFGAATGALPAGQVASSASALATSMQFLSSMAAPGMFDDLDNERSGTSDDSLGSSDDLLTNRQLGDLTAGLPDNREASFVGPAQQPSANTGTVLGPYFKNEMGGAPQPLGPYYVPSDQPQGNWVETQPGDDPSAAPSPSPSAAPSFGTGGSGGSSGSGANDLAEEQARNTLAAVSQAGALQSGEYADADAARADQALSRILPEAAPPTPDQAPQDQGFAESAVLAFLSDYASAVASTAVTLTADLLTFGTYSIVKTVAEVGVAAYQGGAPGVLNDAAHRTFIVGKLMDIDSAYQKSIPFGWDYASDQDKGEAVGHLVLPVAGLLGDAALVLGVEGPAEAGAGPKVASEATAGGFPNIPYEKVGPSNRMLNQTTAMGCGVSCVRQILSDNGVDVTEEQFREAYGFPELINKIGTAPSLLADVANDLSPDLKYQGAGVGSPEIALYKLSNYYGPWVAMVATDASHFLIVDGVQDGIVSVRDPWGMNGPGSGVGSEGTITVQNFIALWDAAAGQFFAPKHPQR